MENKDLVMGFSNEEKERITTNLERLLPHLREGGFVIVGGLAIRYHLLSNSISYPDRPFNDIDIIAKDLDVVSSSVSEDFLIYHHHPQDSFLALVDPVSKIKVDIFRFSPAPQQTIKVPFGGSVVEIVSIEDQLVKTVFDIQRISEKAKVDPKQFTDTRLLMQIADMEKTDEIWKSNKFDKWPKSVVEAIERAEAIAKEHPEWIQEKPFRRPNPYVCSGCQSTDDFQVVRMEQVYKVMGYVE